MAIPVQQFPIFTPEQANPLGFGLQQGLAARLNMLQAQKASLQMPYVADQAAADLLKTQLANQLSQIDVKYKPQDYQSTFALRGAESAKDYASIPLLKQQAAEIAFKLQHPGFMGSEEDKTLQYLKDLGMLNNTNQNAPVPAQNVSQVAPDIQSGIQNLAQQTSSLNSNISPLASKIQETLDQSSKLNLPPVATSLTQGEPEASQNAAMPAIPGVSKDDFDPAPFKTGNSLADSILNKPFAQAAYTNKMTRAFDWVHSTPEAKSYEVAQGAGMGINPDEFIQARANGKSLKDIAIENGFDPKNLPAPDFLPEKGNIEKFKQRQVALKQVNVLSKFVTDGLAPYSQTWHNLSPKQIADALVNKDEDQQAKFLAARSLAPELANLRLMLAQARVGKYTQESMLDKSMTDMRAFQGLVTPSVFKKAQKLVDEKLNEAFDKSAEAYQVGKHAPAKSEEVSGGNENDPLGIL